MNEKVICFGSTIGVNSSNFISYEFFEATDDTNKKAAENIKKLWKNY
jgi:hypothetical protein